MVLNLEKKSLILQVALSSTPNSFDLGRNHLLPYSLPFSEDGGVCAYTKGVTFLCSEAKQIYQAVEWFITSLMPFTLNNFYRLLPFTSVSNLKRPFTFILFDSHQ